MFLESLIICPKLEKARYSSTKEWMKKSGVYQQKQGNIQ